MNAPEFYFDGKKYIPARSAAKLVGYAGAYISQLCREKKIPAKLVGRNWFVEEAPLLKYQEEALLSMKTRGEALPKNHVGKISSIKAEEKITAQKIVPNVPEKIPAKIPKPAIEKVSARKLPRKLPEKLSAGNFKPALSLYASKFPVVKTAELAGKIVSATLALSIVFAVFSYSEHINNLGLKTVMRGTADSVNTRANSTYEKLASLKNLEIKNNGLASVSSSGAGNFGLNNFFASLTATAEKYFRKPYEAVASMEKINRNRQMSSVSSVNKISSQTSIVSPVIKKEETAVPSPKTIAMKSLAVEGSPQIIERIMDSAVSPQVEKQIVASSGGITAEYLNERLNETVNSLKSEIYSRTSQSGPSAFAGLVTVAPMNRIDTLSNVSISGSRITSSSFTGSSLTASSGSMDSLSVSGALTAGSATLGATTFPISKGNFLVGNDAGISQATSSIFISSTGNVGIGTTNPTDKLSVNGNISLNYGALDFGGLVGDHSYQAYVTNNTLNLKGYGAIAFSLVSPSSSTTVMTIGNSVSANSTNVGIGTTSPGSPLDIGMNALATGKGGDFSMVNIANTATSTVGVSLITKAGLKISSTGSWAGTGSSNIGLYVSSVTGGTNNYDAIFNGGGSVGIGTTVPAAKLQVTGSAGVTSFTGTTPSSLHITGATGTGDYNGISFGHTSVANQALAYARIGMVSTISGSNLQFGTSNNGSQGITNTAMTINQNGNVGIGTSTPDALLALQQVTNGTPFISAYRVTDTTPSGDFINYKTNSGTTLFRVDNSGNLLAGGIVNSGSQTITSTSQPQFRVQYDPSNEITVSTNQTGTTTLGLTGTSGGALVFTPQSNRTNTFNFTDASSNSVLSIDTANQRVGIGTTSPLAKLHIVGSGSNLILDGDTSYSRTFFVSGDPTISGVLNRATRTTVNSSKDFYFGETSDTGKWIFRGSGAMTVEGNVGIGTTSPTRKLVIGAPHSSYSGSFASIGEDYPLYLSRGDIDPVFRVNWSGGATLYEDLSFTGSDPSISGLRTLQFSSNWGVDKIVFRTDDTGAKITTDDSGNFDWITGGRNITFSDIGKIGIGTTNPAQKLEVVTDGGANSISSTAYRNSAGQASFDSRFARGSLATPLVVSNGDTIGQFASYPHNGTNFSLQTANIYTKVNGTVTGSSIPTDILFATDAAGSAWNTTPKMVILSGGNVGIGTTSPSARLSVKGGGTTTGRAFVISDSGDAEKIAVLDNGTIQTANNFILNSKKADGTVQQILNYYTDNNLYVDSGSATIFRTSGSSEKMRIDSQGNVGIGTTTPAAPLDVTASLNSFSATGNSLLRLSNTASSGGQSPLDFFIDGTLRGRVRVDSNANMTLVTNGAQGNYNFFTGGDSAVGTVRMTLSNAGGLALGAYAGSDAGAANFITSGNVGIGTTSPGVKLDVIADSIDEGIRVRHSNLTAGISIGYGTIKSNGTATDQNINITPAGAGSVVLSSGLTFITTGLTGNVYAYGNTINGQYSNNASGILYINAYGYQNANTQFRDTQISNGKAENIAFFQGSTGNVGIGTTSPWGQLSVNPNGITGPAFVVGSSTATNFIVANGGNVGIGTASPTAKLLVSNSTPGLNTLSAQGSQGGIIVDAQGTFNSTTGGAAFGSTWVGTGDYEFYSSNARPTVVIKGSSSNLDPLQIRSYLNAVMVNVTNTGNVGIGVTNPAQKLEVAGSVLIQNNNNLYFKNTAGASASGWSINPVVSGNFQIKEESLSLTPFVITTAGNVGIGTTGPGNLLHVNSAAAPTSGQFRITSNSLGSLSLINYAADNQQIGFDVDYASSVWTARNATVGWIRKADGYLNIDGSGGNSVGSAATQTNLLAINLTTGNVGIGTTSPTSLLHLSSSGNPGLSLDTTSAGVPHLDFLSSAIKKSEISYLTSSNLLQFNVNYPSPITAMVINSSGNVGIGTTGPGNLLHVNSAAAPTSGQFRITSNSLGSLSLINYAADNQQIGFDVDYASSVWTARNATVGWIRKADGYLNIDGSGGNSVGSAATQTNLLAINLTTGNVGIGTTSPTSLLHLSSSGNPGLSLDTTSAGVPHLDFLSSAIKKSEISYLTSSNLLQFNVNYPSPITAMVINSSGNVGIGTTSPASKLDIVGADPSMNSVNQGNLHIQTSDSQAINKGGSLTFGGQIGSGQIRNFGGIVGRKSNSTESNQLGYLAFFTNNVDVDGLFAEKMRITSAGNVGIGTTSPASKLDIVGADPSMNSVNQGNLHIQTSDSQAINKGGSLTFGGQIGSGQIRNFGGIVGRKSNSTESNQLGYLAFFTNNVDVDGLFAEKMRITSAGNVGIGTTSPDHLLTIAASQTETNPGTNGANGLRFTNTSLGPGAVLGGMEFYQWQGTRVAGIYATRDAADIVGGIGGNLVFATKNAGAIGERMRIDYNGNVGIGTTSPQQKLVIAGSATEIGTFIDNSNVAGYATLRINSAGVAGAVGLALHSFGSGYSGVGAYTPSTANLTGFDSGGLTLQANNAAGTIRFYTAGSEVVNERMRIDSSGNVGIGTTTPSSILHVRGSTPILTIDSSGANENSWIYFQQNGTSRAVIGYRDTTSALTFYESSADRMVIKSGNVGIGTTSPYSILSISNSATTAVNTPLFTIASTTGGTSTSTLMTVLANGNVGIGTTTPSTILHINGTASGGIRLTGDQLQVTGIPNAVGVASAESGGIGLFMFSSSGGIHFNTAGNQTEKMLIANNGNVTFANYGAGACCSDIAEFYPSSEAVEAADIMSADPTASTTLRKARINDTVIGIVSTNPALAIDEEHLLIAGGTENYVANPTKPVVALSGRVPVKVTTENGVIKIGDRITLSLSTPGVGMKATTSSYTIGIALENFDPLNGENGNGTSTPVLVNPQPTTDNPQPSQHWEGKVMVFVNLSWSHIEGITEDTTSNPFWTLDEVTGKMKARVAMDMNGMNIVNVSAITSASGKWSIDENGVITAEEVNTKNLKVTSPNGFTIYDEDTNQPMCVKSKSGALVTVPGECSSVSATSTPPTPETPADTEAPVITVNGNNPATLNIGETYGDLGATVTDNVNQNLGVYASLDGGATTTPELITIDTSIAGTHTIFYSSTDQAGNMGTATRTVNVEEPAPTP